MGFERYLSWNDAIYGTSDNRINNNNSFPKNCTVAANSAVWTVIFFSLL